MEDVVEECNISVAINAAKDTRIIRKLHVRNSGGLRPTSADLVRVRACLASTLTHGGWKEHVWCKTLRVGDATGDRRIYVDISLRQEDSLLAEITPMD